jgi:hypothetical protein
MKAAASPSIPHANLPIIPSNRLKSNYNSGHSHSIVFGHCDALNFLREFLLRTLEHRVRDQSEIWALDSKQEFRRSAICSVSATIGIN